MITWVDLETTGLDPHRHMILEMAILLTDDDLKVVAGKTWLYPLRPDMKLDMDDVVQEMHTKSNLLADCITFYWDLYNQKDGAGSRSLYPSNVEEFLKEYNAVGNLMAGNSVHFDRTFLISKWGAETVNNLFHHRNIDVSTIKETAKLDAPWVHDGWKEECEIAYGDKPHRAMPDVTVSIEEYRFYRSAMRTGTWMPTSLRGPSGY